MRRALIAVGIMGIVFTVFSFWLRYHAETAIENLVSTQSKGKLELKLKKFKLNWINNKIELLDAVFYNTDSSSQTKTELISPKISIKALGFLPFLLNRQILIDSVHIYNPSVVVTKSQKTTTPKLPTPHSNIHLSNTNFSIGKELGKLANSIQQAIEVLKINRFVIDDGKFSLLDKTSKNSRDFVIDKIQIHLDNLQVDDSTRTHSKRRIAFTDDIAIQTTNQNLIFPGGLHFLSFKNFRFGLRDQRVTFDSCMVRGIKGDSSKSAFNIYFDKLELTKINFDTLYASDVIQADSAFCKNPKITLDIDADQAGRTKGDNKIQNIDDLVEQLLGDIMVNFVVVKNADVKINTINNQKTNTFTSEHVNFELKGLKVMQHHEKPVTVERLFMNLQNYETHLQNGRYYLAFDSVRFENNVLTLTNFNFKEYAKNKIIKTLKMPGFEIGGLSWESLLYNNSFNANSARLFSPTITVDATTQKRKASKNIFEVFQNINRLLNLPDLNIHNGRIFITLDKNASLALENSDFSVFADKLIESKKMNTLLRAVKQAAIEKAIYTQGALNIVMNHVSLFEPHKGIKAKRVFVQDEGLNIELSNFHIEAMPIDSLRKTITVNGVNWEKGSFKINHFSKTNGFNNTGKIVHFPIIIKNCTGKATNISVSTRQQSFSMVVPSFKIHEFYKPVQGALQVKGLYLSARDALFAQSHQRLTIASLTVADNINSIWNSVNFIKKHNADSIYVKIPQLSFSADIGSLLTGNFHFKKLKLINPQITASLGGDPPVEKTEPTQQPNIFLDTAWFEKPEIQLTLINAKNQPVRVLWKSNLEKSIVKLTQFSSNTQIPIAANQVNMYLTGFEYYNANGKHIATNDNNLNLRFDGLNVHKNHQNKIEWEANAHILSLDKLFFDSLGRQYGELQLNKGKLYNIKLNSNQLGSVFEILKNSDSLNLIGTEGAFTSSFHRLNWHNFSFQKNYFTADSIVLKPLQSLDDYKIKRAFPQDYLTINSGALIGGPFDLQKLGNDSVFAVRNLDVQNMNLFTFKDKRHESANPISKLLPVAQIINIPAKLSIDSLKLNNMLAEYWEINSKTHQLGLVPVSNINGLITNIKNYNIEEDDSLNIFVSGDIVHKLHTTLSVRQSYKDTSGAFLMKLRTGPVSLPEFNTVLVPLEAIKVLKGHLDSLSVEASGNNDYSLGRMRMYYKNLKFSVLDKKDLKNQMVSNRLFSWLANSFVIRRKYSGKPSPVFFERHKNRSAINFLIKITLSGVKSSAGIPGVKSKEKKYLKQVSKKKTYQPTPE